MKHMVTYAIIGTIEVDSDDKLKAEEKFFNIHGQELCNHANDLYLQAIETEEEYVRRRQGKAG